MASNNYYVLFMLSFMFRKMGFTVVLTITPFVSTSSSNFLTGVEQSLFVKELSRLEETDEYDDVVVKSQSRTIPPALTSYKVR